jgi:endonuclease-3 related protein
MAKIQTIYTKLLKEYGKQGWWPLSKSGLHSKHHNGLPVTDADRFEIIVGAILTQNTNWNNVEKALFNLNKAKMLSVNRIKNCGKQKLGALIRPCGYYNQKAERLSIMAEHLSKYKSIKLFFNRPLMNIRDELLSIKGIGPETADSILLYAGLLPIFVVDAYTKRIFSRLGFFDEHEKYDKIQDIFMKLRKNQKMFSEYHALIVEHAKQHCKKNPICSGCVLRKSCKF